MLGLKGVSRISCKFEYLEKYAPWFVEGVRDGSIVVEDAVVEIENSKLLWRLGIWKNGIWEKGTWKNGIWKSGIWKEGYWSMGTWENGYWKKGIWENGIWKKGIWEGGIWFNGTWLSGIWKKGIWEGGTWYDGKDSKGNIHADPPNTWNTPVEKSTNGKILVITDQGSLDRKAKVEDMINNTYVVKVPAEVEKWEISRKMTALERTRKDVHCLVNINESAIISWNEFVELTKTKEETLKEKIIAELKNSSLSIEELIEKIKSL
jgi:hypothetical protein